MYFRSEKYTFETKGWLPKRAFGGAALRQIILMTRDGQQLLTFQGADGGEALAVGRLCRGACVLGMGGLGVAVLSNTLEADNACVVKLATVLCIELGIGVPLDF